MPSTIAPATAASTPASLRRTGRSAAAEAAEIKRTELRNARSFLAASDTAKVIIDPRTRTKTPAVATVGAKSMSAVPRAICMAIAVATATGAAEYANRKAARTGLSFEP
jgi:hypothetical protein